MVSLLGACGFILHGIFILFYQIFVWHVSSKESIIFISFYNKIWLDDDVTTALCQNQIIVIVYSIFLKSLNKVYAFWMGDFTTTKINVFWKKHKKQISPLESDFSQKSLVGLLNHLWYKPKTMKLFFSRKNVRWKKGLNIIAKLIAKAKSMAIMEN